MMILLALINTAVWTVLPTGACYLKKYVHSGNNDFLNAGSEYKQQNKNGIFNHKMEKMSGLTCFF